MKRNLSFGKIKEIICNSPKGSIFLTSDFLDVASSDAANKALLRLEEAGIIRRILFGMYEYPEFNSFLNEYVEPSSILIAQTLAKKYGWTIIPCGDTALNMLGLSTQVPSRLIYVSDGPYKIYSYNKISIEFKHTSNKEISKVSYKTALVIQALKALGKENMDDNVIKKIASLLTNEECVTMYSEAKYVTSWIYDIIKKVYEEYNEKSSKIISTKSKGAFS